MNSIFFRSWCRYVPCLQHSVCSLLLTPRTEVHGYKMFRAYGSINANQFAVMIEYTLRGLALAHSVTTDFSLLADRRLAAAEKNGYKMFRAYGSINANQFAVMIEYTLRGLALAHSVTTEFSLLADRQTCCKGEK